MSIPNGTPHVDYPHQPGRLPDCPACEAECHCGEDHDESCVAGPFAHPMNDGKLYHTTRCVWPGHDDEGDDL
ncbi:hypothetical protein [Microbispora sp. NPDC049125]|uniref:hypothetical protein n=1 Tax=Microbispora sp. NPDC049125 TaxID=3154929 RepID=UPI00346737AC